MTKRKKAPSLAEFMQEDKPVELNSSNVAENKAPANAPVPTAGPPSKTPPKASGAKKSQAKGVDTAIIPVYLPRPVKKQLEKLWFEERESGITQSGLLLEGLDRVFKNRGLPSIKQIMEE